MSYVRFGQDDSDVYVYEHVDGYYCCCMCALEDCRDHHETPAAFDMAEHLRDHRRAGHHVPQWAIDRLVLWPGVY